MACTHGRTDGCCVTWYPAGRQQYPINGYTDAFFATVFELAAIVWYAFLVCAVGFVALVVIGSIFGPFYN